MQLRSGSDVIQAFEAQGRLWRRELVSCAASVFALHVFRAQAMPSTTFDNKRVIEEPITASKATNKYIKYIN